MSCTRKRTHTHPRAPHGRTQQPVSHHIPFHHHTLTVGISITTKITHLWHVGHGLPLDALKKGTITEWSCNYRLADGEVMPLLDALSKNTSLSRLNLAEAGLEWMGPESSKERSGAPLIDAMVASHTALAELQHFVVSASSAYEIPVGRLRKGGDEAIGALREAHLMQRGGPRRLEILMMADLLRKNRGTAAPFAAVEESASAVVKLLDLAKGGKVSVDEWESRVVAMMAAGETRRAHFKALLGAALLQQVGFTASALLEADFTPAELREGGYSASELRNAGFTSVALKSLGYPLAEMQAAGLTVVELHGLFACSAAELRAIGRKGGELKDAKVFSLATLREAGYSVLELHAAGCKAAELRAAGFGANELRNADVFSNAELRNAGYLLNVAAPMHLRQIARLEEERALERDLAVAQSGDHAV